MIKRAIILSAGQGSRLLPLTLDVPKCLIDFSGKTLIEWQIQALAANGIEDIVVVTGFHSEKVDEVLARQTGVLTRTLFNPFYKVADNLGSCWLARREMDQDFIILNGDTLVAPEIVQRLIEGSAMPITVTIDIKDSYDSDDMKVTRSGDRLVAIGKRLSAGESDAESIGMLAFRGEGAALFRSAVDEMMHTPEGVKNWYLKVIDSLAPSGSVGTVSIAGMDWAEVDFPEDVEIATALTRRWAEAA